MSLVNLPAELLIEIVRLTLPLGYESFMLSCKRINQIGEEFLEEHNRLRRKFKHFRYADEIKCSPELLKHISREPLIAEYIQTADFSNDIDRSTFEQVAWAECNFLDPQSNGNSIKKILKRSKLPTNVNMNTRAFLDMFAMRGSRGNEAIVTTIILLATLPNIRELILPPQWHYLHPPIGDTADEERVMPWKALDTIVSKALTSYHRDGMLSNLTKIQTTDSWGELPPLPLNNLGPFFILPSLREVRAPGSLANTGHHSGRPFNWRYPLYPYSNLESIELVGSCVDGTQLELLLSHASRLQSFKLSYATKWYGCGVDWDSSAVFDALRRHSAESLTRLCITVDLLHGSLKGGLRSLKAFAKLEHLKLDVRVFFGPPLIDDKLRAMSPVDYRNYAYEVAHWNGLSVPSLAEILPSSIQTVKLFAGSCREEVLILKGLFAKLNLFAPERLPQLRSLTVMRARRQLFRDFVAEGQSATAWESVGNLVREMGYHFEEAENVRADTLC